MPMHQKGDELMHKKFTKRFFTFLITLALAGSMAACGSAATGSTTGSTSSVSSETSTSGNTEATTVEKVTATSTAGNATTVAAVTTGGAIDASDMFTERDLTQIADTSEATTYEVTDGQKIEITEAGVYVITGTATNATITVSAADEDKVQIVLDNANITNDSKPVIYVKSADKVFVTTAAGSENSLSVTGTFTADGSTNTDAVIFSKEDLVLNGLGTLSITSSENGITSKDDLKITGGTINLSVADAALESKDDIEIADGTINITGCKDALHAEDDDDDSKGFVYICGGTLTINASDDGIHATTIVQIDGGTVNISASEGIEGTWIQINDGTVNITATDDGINAANKSKSYSPKAEFNGGTVTIDMGQGDTDGVDSNGDIIINGGTISVTGQSTFDYDGTGTINGGTVICNGEQVTTLPNQMMGGGGMGGDNMGGDNMGGARGPH